MVDALHLERNRRSLSTNAWSNIGLTIVGRPALLGTVGGTRSDCLDVIA